MDNLVLLDLDGIVYSAGFAAEKRTYVLNREIEFSKKTDLNNFVKQENLKDPEIDAYVDIDPLENAIHNCRILLQSILDACAPLYQYQGFLSGKGNFRNEIAVTLPYKGNRDPKHKPKWYKEIREYLVDQWQAKIVDGIEADDALTIEFTKNSKCGIISSTDKDFLQIPNLRMYNWKSKKHVFVNTLEALRNFYTQVLTGDRTDNIGGVKGIGKVKAHNLLKDATSEAQMIAICKIQYKIKFGNDSERLLQENAELLYLLRAIDDKYDGRLIK